MQSDLDCEKNYTNDSLKKKKKINKEERINIPFFPYNEFEGRGVGESLCVKHISTKIK